MVGHCGLRQTASRLFVSLAATFLGIDFRSLDVLLVCCVDLLLWPSWHSLNLLTC